jgi:hypothetical protein
MIRPHRHMRSRQRLGLLVAEGTSLAALGTSCLRLAMHSSVVYLDFYNRIIPVLRGSVSCYVTQVRRIFKHRDVTSHVESDLEGDTFRFEFTIDGNTTRGKTRTKLIGLAKRRVTILINRKLLERKRQLIVARHQSAPHG